jgi:hypothetical protein
MISQLLSESRSILFFLIFVKIHTKKKLPLKVTSQYIGEDDIGIIIEMHGRCFEAVMWTDADMNHSTPKELDNKFCCAASF